MAKQLAKGTHLTRSVRRIAIAGKTRAGVWVIVGMALFFVVGGLGTGAFIAWKAIVGKAGPPAAQADGESAKVAPAVANASSVQAGVVQPKPMTEDGGTPPAGASDRVEHDQVHQDELKRIDLMQGLSDSDNAK